MGLGGSGATRKEGKGEGRGKGGLSFIQTVGILLVPNLLISRSCRMHSKPIAETSELGDEESFIQIHQNEKVGAQVLSSPTSQRRKMGVLES